MLALWKRKVSARHSSCLKLLDMCGRWKQIVKPKYKVLHVLHDINNAKEREKYRGHLEKRRGSSWLWGYEASGDSNWRFKTVQVFTNRDGGGQGISKSKGQKIKIPRILGLCLYSLQGDSGGPLHCSVNGQYVIHGVTSFVSSLGCNVARKPTVFTRVSAYISWMNNVSPLK